MAFYHYLKVSGVLRLYILMNQLKLQEIQKYVVSYGHWIALVVSICIILFTVKSSFDNNIQVQCDKANRQLQSLIKQMESKVPQEEKLPEYLKDIDSIWCKNDAAITTLPLDFIYEKAKETYHFGVAPTNQYINKPSNLQLATDREKINITWDEPEELEKDGKSQKLPEIGGYHLRKTWKENGKPMTKVIALEETSYEDTAIEPKVEYTYDVRCWTDNIDAKGGTRETDKVMNQDIICSDYTEKKTGSILPVYELTIKGVAKDSAFLELRKWEKGDWRSTSLTVKKGEKIVKRDYNKELQKQIFFDPGWTLVAVKTSVKRVREVKKKELDIDPITNQVRLDENNKFKYIEKVEKQQYTGPAIQYSDEKGNLEIKYKDSK